MGVRGPRPQLPEITKITGNSGKRPVNATTVVATGTPFVADFLSDDEKACIELIKLNMPPAIYKTVDGFLLSAFATQWAIFKQATEARTADPRLLIPGSMKQEVPNGLIGIQANAILRMASLGDRLGLDPKSRAALSLPKDGKPKSKFGDLIGGTAPN